MMPAALDRLEDRLRSRGRQQLTIDGFRRAGVLVPLLETDDGLEVLFTVRSSSLPHHAGQIAFPGGGVEPGEGAVGAALRETYEEIGVAVAPEAVLGCLDDHPSPARYVATPVVARVPWPQMMALNPSEVDEVFTVPLGDLAALEPHSEVRQLQQQDRRRIYWYEWGERTIWGFTGNVVKNLLYQLEESAH